MKHQLDLFDGYVRLRNCRKCKRKLHVDPNNNYSTREAGLCFACIRAFEASQHWTVEAFLDDKPVDPETAKAVEEFCALAKEFVELMDSAPMLPLKKKDDEL